MANAGLLVRNSGGVIVIDGQYHNPSMRAKGTAVTATIKGSGSYVSFTVGGLTATPVIAVSSTLGAIAHVSSFASGSALVEIIAHGPVGTSVPWWIFDKPGIASPPKYFVVRNAAGEVVFNANERYMRVAGVMQVNGITGGSLTLPSGRTYASYFGTPVGRSVTFTQTGVPQDDHWYITAIRRFVAINDGAITTNEADVGQSGPYVQVGAPARYQFDGTAFLLDVTNY
jgi:hypothetical protein